MPLKRDQTTTLRLSEEEKEQIRRAAFELGESESDIIRACIAIGLPVLQKYQSRKKVCSVCGREFYAKYASAVYCSDICRAQKNRAYCAKQKERRTETRRTFLAVLALVLEKKEQTGPKEKSKRCRAVHEPRICPVCGTSFVPVRSTKIYCCSSCACKNFRKKSRKAYSRVCPVCGKEFETAYIKKLWCSAKCKQKAERKHKKNVLLLMKPFKRECPVCGIRFYSTGNTFCSSKCENMDW